MASLPRSPSECFRSSRRWLAVVLSRRAVSPRRRRVASPESGAIKRAMPAPSTAPVRKPTITAAELLPRVSVMISSIEAMGGSVRRIPPEQRRGAGLNATSERQNAAGRFLHLVENRRSQSTHAVTDGFELERAPAQSVGDVLKREDHLLRLGRGPPCFIDPEGNLVREPFEPILAAPVLHGRR